MDRLKYGLIGLLFIVLVILYVLEFPWFDRTINARTMTFFALAIGIILGLGLGWAYRGQARDKTEKVQLYVFFVFICGLFAPLAASLGNRLLSPYPPRAETVEFIEEKQYFSEPFGLLKGEKPKPDGYLSFFYYEGELRRVKNETPLFSGRNRGEEAQIMMRRGLWGFDIVQRR